MNKELNSLKFLFFGEASPNLCLLWDWGQSEGVLRRAVSLAQALFRSCWITDRAGRHLSL